MSAIVTWAEVREAARLDASYKALVKRRAWAGALRRGGRWWPVMWEVGFPAIGAFIWWAIALVIPAAALLAVEEPDRLVAFFMSPMSVVAVLGMLKLADRAAVALKLDAVQALRAPSRSALVLGRLTRLGPWLAWVGACAAVAVSVLGGARGWTAPTIVLVCLGMLLLPLVCVVRDSVGRALTKSRDGRASWRTGLVILALTIAAAGAVAWSCGLGALRGWWWALLIVPSGVGAVADDGRMAARLPWALADAVWRLLAVGFLCAPQRVFDAMPSASVTVCATFFAIYPFLAIPIFVRSLTTAAQSIEADFASVTPSDAATAAADRAPEPRRTYGAWPPLPRAMPGRGLWRAAWEKWRAADVPRLPRRAADGTGAGAAAWAQFCGLAVLQIVLFGTGPLFAGLAAGVSSRPAAGPLLFAFFAALFARRAVADGLASRLYLLGVDYRTQTMVDLRAMLLAAALPSIGVALAAAAIRGFPQDAVVGVAGVAAFLLLRAGWAGIVGESKRAFGCLGVAVIPAIVVAVGKSPASPTWILGCVTALGVVGLVRRLFVLDEARLRRQMLE
ncbi:MAG: hypothetical protein K8T90_02550 [Planctomycetes bacterium]|nr:hypothetical protein [Planctomycetota bacterium]